MFRLGFFGFVLLVFGLLVARVFMSFGLVAGAVGHTVAVTSGPAELQRIVSEVTHGFRAVADTVSTSVNAPRTISVLDVSTELAARRRNPHETKYRPEGPLIIKINY